jgi:hypothetical protein
MSVHLQASGGTKTGRSSANNEDFNFFDLLRINGEMVVNRSISRLKLPQTFLETCCVVNFSAAYQQGGQF